MTKHLHIITLNIPFPANFGGVIDVFYRIVALYELGIQIHLHCFKYQRDETKELEKYCKKVYYYDRNMSWKNLLSQDPFIVKSRRSDILITRLKENPFPILYDGMHCTATLNNPTLRQKKFIRTHNVEKDYYSHLTRNESNILIKLLLHFEHLKLSAYERKIDNAKAVLAISRSDQMYFSKFKKSHLIRAFHSNTFIQSKLGVGDYALYHGNLTVSENIKALQFLLKKVFLKIDYPIVVAGKIKSKKLIREIRKNPNIQLVENPSQNIMSDLIQNAQMILLPTFQNTGIKLKLLESLFKGRFCIVNNVMVVGSELHNYCIQANSAEEWIKEIKKLKEASFTEELLENRKSLIELFNNINEAQKIEKIIFN
ncbi:MAG: glycosyltransferase [Bacteroidetes bacterium]|nr:glycosyltransferase [Bacteroidota bacterium]